MEKIDEKKLQEELALYEKRCKENAFIYIRGVLGLQKVENAQLHFENAKQDAIRHDLLNKILNGNKRESSSSKS